MRFVLRFFGFLFSIGAIFFLIGAAGLAYRDGISAGWWVGSAGLGSLVFAFTVAPRMWGLGREHDV